MANETYSIRLPMFEGPMDLLVYLVRKHDMDITDIPIAEITEQYLGYLNMMSLLNIDFAGDFLYMAATLAHIKSRTLLPSQDEEGEDEDPRLEIARPLLEYLKLKSAADHLSTLPMLGRDVFTGGLADDETLTDEEPEITLGLFELVDTFRRIMDSRYRDHAVDFSTNRMSVKDRIMEIVAVFEQTPRIHFHALFDPSDEKSMVVLTFLAILEMAKLNLIDIRQHVQSGLISLCYR
ncbi:segregation/condensation protein A [Desulfatiferula olefinivorans]